VKKETKMINSLFFIGKIDKEENKKLNMMKSFSHYLGRNVS